MKKWLCSYYFWSAIFIVGGTLCGALFGVLVNGAVSGTDQSSRVPIWLCFFVGFCGSVFLLPAAFEVVARFREKFSQTKPESQKLNPQKLPEIWFPVEKEKEEKKETKNPFEGIWKEKKLTGEMR